MREFEERLQVCLQALQEGRWDIDECVRRYPEHADELRAQLLVAASLGEAYDAQPREEWAARARARFLIGTGERLQEALAVEPEVSFLAGARMRFLMAAQRLRGEAARTRAPRRVPGFGSPRRAFAGVAASLAIFIGFSTYTVATANAALPGDWQYPVKLQTERVRLALAFTEAQERDVKLDIAEERVREIERLASKGKIIGPGVINRLVEQTEPLVEEAASEEWDGEAAARLRAVSVTSANVLRAAEPQISPDAGEKLAEAVDLSKKGQQVAWELFKDDPDRPLLVVEPHLAVVTPEPTAAPPTEAPVTPADPTVETTVDPVETPATETPPANEQTTDRVVFGETPMVELGEIKLHKVTAGRLQLLSPGPGTGWYLENVPVSGVPPAITMTTQDKQSFIVVSTVTGEAWWYFSPAKNGRFDEIRLYKLSNGQVLIQVPDDLRRLYGSEAEIPILVMQSIRILPEPTPEPEPTVAAEPSPEAAQ
jgi:hypothetical protein